MTSVSAHNTLKTGAQVLAARGFQALAGQRVGLITNHTAIVGSMHLSDVLAAASNLKLISLFGPEHGIRGIIDDALPVSDAFDDRLGVPIYSLYGDHLKPQPDAIQDLDVLVFDIQDVGVRFYTYISTMGLAMQAASEAGVPFVVLDRPNPLGGLNVSGYVLEPIHASFEGLYPIPIQHGLTVGELAKLIQGERLLPGLDTLQLTVIPMEGWQRDMLWPDTGLPWIKTSSNIPDFEVALIYPGACFFEATSASEGRGTYTPFKVLGAPWADGDILTETLNKANLPGVHFESTSFTPQPIKEMGANPKLKGALLHGIRHIITDTHAYMPVATGIHVLHAFYQQSLLKGVQGFIDRPAWLTRLAGTDRFYNMLTNNTSPQTIIAGWQHEVDVFRRKRIPYLLY